MKLPNDIGFVALWCRDLARQRAFFTDALGLSVRHATEEAVVLGGGAPLLVLHATGPTTLHLAGTAQFGYFVEDLEGWTDHLVRKGADVWRSAADLGDGKKLIAVKTPAGQFLVLAG